jgi:hypothetical protein
MSHLHEFLCAHSGWTLMTDSDWLSVDDELARWETNCPGWPGPRVTTVAVAGHPEARGLVALDAPAVGMLLGVLLPPAEVKS